MNAGRQALRRVRPRRRQHQALGLIVGVTLLTMLLLYAASTSRMETLAVEGSRQWAEAVARAAASAGAASVALDDLATLETTLRDIATMPGVLRIDAVDADARLLLTLHREPDGRIRPDWHEAGATPSPAVGSDQGHALREVQAGEPVLQAWAPIGPGGQLGRIGVTFSLDKERSQLARLRWDAMLGTGIAALLIVGVVHLMLGRMMAPLARLVRHARALAGDPGVQLVLHGGSLEVRELADALNDASARMHDQLQRLGASEQRTAAIVQAVPDAVIGVDALGLIVVASPAVTHVFGIEPDGLVGQPLAQWLPGLDAAAAEERAVDGIYNPANDSHIVRFDARGRRHGGGEFAAEVSMSRVATGTTRFVCVVRDLTEQRRAQDMLHLYGRALECTTNGVVISDMALPGSPVFYANPAFQRITGYAPGEAIGRNCDFLQGGDRDQPELQVLRDAIRAQQPASVVLRNYRKDGTLFFNELSIAPVATGDGAVRHYVGVLNDVTERERSRLAIAERSARLNAVFELSPDGFVVFDREGQLVYSNQAFRAMTGWSAEQLAQGLSLAQFDARLRELCQGPAPYPPLSTLDGGDSGFETMDLLHLTQPRMRVLTRLARHNAGGQGESILYFRDVTHETEVDRMKSEFLTTAAHELRTPMVSVFGFTELLLNRPVPEDQRRDVLQTIHRQASVLINMVNELLDLARIESRQGKDLQRSPHRLGALLGPAVRAVLDRDGGREARLVSDHGDAVVVVDPEKFGRALTNVLSNAYKYSPDGGEVVVQTLDGELAGRPAVGVRVTDRGIGMSREQRERVFERFYRADPSGNIPGTGLGMSLVKEIVELHGGRVDIDSELGRGTRVTLWLPLASTAEAAAADLH